MEIVLLRLANVMNETFKLYVSRLLDFDLITFGGKIRSGVNLIKLKILKIILKIIFFR